MVKNLRQCVCAYIQRLLRAFARYKFLLCLISRLHISDRYSENIWQTPLTNIFDICLLNGHTAPQSAIYVFRYVPTRHVRHGHSLAILGHALGAYLGPSVMQICRVNRHKRITGMQNWIHIVTMLSQFRI